VRQTHNRAAQHNAGESALVRSRKTLQDSIKALDVFFVILAGYPLFFVMTFGHFLEFPEHSIMADAPFVVVSQTFVVTVQTERLVFEQSSEGLNCRSHSTHCLVRALLFTDALFLFADALFFFACALFLLAFALLA